METQINLTIQPPRTYKQKQRLARNLRTKGKSEADVKAIVWHKDNSPKK